MRRRLDLVLLRFLAFLLLRLTRSGKFALPVSLFHSSNVSFEILPSTSSWANLRRWAWLLNGTSDQMHGACHEISD